MRHVISKAFSEAASLKRTQKFFGTRRNNIRRGIKRSVCGQNLSVPLGFSRRIEPQHVATVISFEFLKRMYRTVAAQYWSRAIRSFIILHFLSARKIARYARVCICAFYIIYMYVHDTCLSNFSISYKSFQIFFFLFKDSAAHHLKICIEIIRLEMN